MSTATKSMMIEEVTARQYASEWMEKNGNLPLVAQFTLLKEQMTQQPNRIAGTLIGFSLLAAERMAREEIESNAETYHRLYYQAQGKMNGWDACVNAILDLSAQAFRKRDDTRARELRNLADELTAHLTRKEFTAASNENWQHYELERGKLHPEEK